ncbi:hypothetical protein VSU19_12030 [Verrucomicrobiales bacterium BCK34]|nr:hypothetical protein [Verrucomicrobiales bacterium BCK34]
MGKKTKFKAGCGVASVFGAGFLCGAIALFIIIVKIIPLSEGWKDEESKEFVINHLANRLKLTEKQVEDVTPIVRSALDERYAHRKVYIEADIELTRLAFEEMKPFLDAGQQTRAKKMFDEWKKGKKRFLLPLE